MPILLINALIDLLLAAVDIFWVTYCECLVFGCHSLLNIVHVDL